MVFILNYLSRVPATATALSCATELSALSLQRKHSLFTQFITVKDKTKIRHLSNIDNHRNRAGRPTWPFSTQLSDN